MHIDNVAQRREGRVAVMRGNYSGCNYPALERGVWPSGFDLGTDSKKTTEPLGHRYILWEPGSDFCKEITKEGGQ